MELRDSSVKHPLLQTPMDENSVLKYEKELNEERVSIVGETYNEIPEWIGLQYPTVKEMTLANCGLTYEIVSA